MRKKLLILLFPLSVAVIALCFVFPSAYFSRQDTSQLALEETVLVNDAQDVAALKVSVFDRLEMARSTEYYTVTELSYAENEANRAVDKATFELKKIISHLWFLSGMSYQLFRDSVVQPIRRYSVSDSAERSFTAWEMDFKFEDADISVFDNVRLRAVYDEQTEKILRLFLYNRNNIYWTPDSSEFDMLGALLSIYYETDTDYELEFYYECSALITLKSEDRTESIPVLYCGDILAINYPEDEVWNSFF